MNVEELSTLTVDDLRERANASLAGVSEMSAMERQHHLVEAQFYIDEIERRAERQDRRETSRIATRDLILEIIVIVLIGVEIYIGWKAIQAGNVDSDKQAGILSTLKQSVDALNNSTAQTARETVALSNAQAQALETEKQTLSAMRNQLNILKDDQKQMQEQGNLLAEQLENMRSQTSVLQRQWERENQRPSVLVIVGSNVLHPDSLLSIDWKKPKQTRVVMSFSLRNIGTATLRRPQLRADVELPARLECVLYSGTMLDIENPCTIPSPQLPDILADTDESTNQQHVRKQSDLNLYVSFIVPDESTGFRVHYTVSADNLSAAVYSLDVHFRN